jgi:hypothetical protein
MTSASAIVAAIVLTTAVAYATGRGYVPIVSRVTQSMILGG